MKILVLGAGLAGVTSAWYLARDGHQVTVVERQDGPALETSFANGGQISVSHPEPWANPGAPLQILRWLGRKNAPLRFPLRANWEQWQFGLRFLGQCLPGRTRRNMDAIAHLAVYSRQQLQALREETGIEYDALQKGILHLYFTRSALRQARKKVPILQDYGIPAEMLDPDACLALEPALAHLIKNLRGGMYAPQDESGDAHKFTCNLAVLCAQKGVQFHYKTRIQSLSQFGNRVTGAYVVDDRGRRGLLSANAVVLAAGSFSPRLMQPLDEKLPIYPIKGYSLTLPLAPEAPAPQISITDEAHRIVISNLGDRLRIAGTAEFCGFDTSIDKVRCEAIRSRARALFPQAVDAKAGECWAGLRPATASNVPIIGESRFEGLYYNTGHGTLGWTLACGSARSLADIIAGRQPEPEFPFQAPKT